MTVAERLLRPTAAIIIVALLLAVIQFLPMTTSAKYQRVLVDLGHVPLFAAIALALVHLIRMRKQALPSVAATCAATGVLVLLLALTSEAVQALDPERSVSMGDVFRNLAGAVLGLIMHRLHRLQIADRQSDRLRKALISIGVIVICAVLLPLAWTTAAYAHRLDRWPEVIGHSYWLERVFIAAYESEIGIIEQPDSSRTDRRERALLLNLPDCHLCGVLLQELRREWMGLSRMCLEVTPRDSPVDLSVRLGNAPMFFRSSTVYTASLQLAPNRRTRRCLPFTAFSPTTAQADPAIGFRSAAILTTDSPKGRELLLHRVWFE